MEFSWLILLMWSLGLMKKAALRKLEQRTQEQNQHFEIIIIIFSFETKSHPVAQTGIWESSSLGVLMLG